MESCQHCGAGLKTGMLSSNSRLPKSRVRIISLATGVDWPEACGKCGDEAYLNGRRSLEQEAQRIERHLKTILPRVPVLSLQQPMGWKYNPITIVTAQTVTGTGLFSDVASTFTDLFGTQSGSYNAKLREGENFCKSSLRAQTIELGGNAIIGVDVDYAEVGGTRAMLMVCMTGTAIEITDFSVDDEDFLPSIAEGYALAKRARALQDALKAPDYPA